MKFQTPGLILVSIIFISIGFFVQQKSEEPAISDYPTNEYSPAKVSAPLIANIIGMSRPEFSLLDVDEKLQNVKQWDGKVLLLNFWATWCLPCLKEIPDLVSLQSKYKDELQIVGIALQKPDGLADFMREYNMNYPVLAGEAPVIVIAEMYGNTIGALPYTAIVDRAGTIVYTMAGPIVADDVETIVKELL
ncbi:MAG: TlpA family protein disulfide reductase [Gammaproteobacteria bacterium]|jgi:peroxiredoxin